MLGLVIYLIAGPPGEDSLSGKIPSLTDRVNLILPLIVILLIIMFFLLLKSHVSEEEVSRNGRPDKGKGKTDWFSPKGWRQDIRKPGEHR